jgi:ribose transport system ATP-binding protein
MSTILEIRELSKEFSGNRALISVSLRIDTSEIHVLVGQNGSGKSTLIKVLAGYHVPEPSTSILIENDELHFGRPEHAYRLGCRFVHQDLGLVGSSSILDNLFLGTKYPMRWGFIDQKAARRSASKMLQLVGLDLDPRTKVEKLSASQRTAVAIARALRPDPDFPVRLLVLDEPTASLPANEVNEFLDTVRAAASQGVGVLYVTHRMDEVFRIGDSITILRDGVAVHSGPIDQIDEGLLVTHLTGDALTRRPEANLMVDPGKSQTVLSVQRLCTPAIRDVSFEVASGEILGIAGITGSGREALLGAIFGATPRSSGEVFVDSKKVPRSRPDLSIGLGVGFLPPDRKISGGFTTLSARQNLTILNTDKFWHRLLMRPKQEQAEALQLFERMDVRPAKATNQVFERFSGGNQQKILFGKWLSKSPRVFLMDEPTQGVDVGAKADLHAEIFKTAAGGTAVVISSTDLEELADVCSRVLVMLDGRIDRELTGPDVTVANLTSSFVTERGSDGPNGD